jgi:hypothetical protein
VLYQLSYGPLDLLLLLVLVLLVLKLPPSFPRADPPAFHHGQGQNRTADTMIFSHVLYQLSYLAQTKNPPEPPAARTGASGEGPALPAPRSRPRARAPRIRHGPKNRLLHSLSSEPGRGKRRPAAALHGNSGGGIRTRDLRVMSPTSYQTAPPRNRDQEITRRGAGRSTRHRGCGRRARTSSFGADSHPADT